MKLEDDYITNRGNGSGTSVGYTVEAKYDYPAPVQIGDQLFDNRWRNVSFSKSPIGVPCTDDELNEHGLMTYTQANALRWWFHAQANAEHKGWVLVTRLISHKLEKTWKVTATEAHEIHGGDGNESTIKPRKDIQS